MADLEIANSLVFTKRQAMYILTILGIILFIVFGIIWWQKIYKNPERTFWGMFDTSLATSGFTRHIKETSNGLSIDEYEQLELGSKNVAQSITTLNQTGAQVSQNTISTLTTDYSRYTSINTDVKGSDGKLLNYSKVIDLWSKSAPPAIGRSNDPTTHLFGQAVLGTVPIANLSSIQRANLIKEIHSKHVYTADFSSVRKERQLGREVYVYNVRVQPLAYAALMQNFATDIGIGKVSELDPGNFQTTQPLSLQFTIDVLSRELVGINYTGSSHTEQYSGYGLQPAIALPIHTISSYNLQQRLAETK